MRRSFFPIIMTAVTAIMPLSISAQTETINTDYLYIFGPDSMPSHFTDAGEDWTITFSNVDTLGCHYDQPVMMMIEGGPNDRQLSYPIAEIDSVLMFQPEAVVRDGVFDITEEYFPYIVHADSTRVVFDEIVSHYLSMPFVGDKIVSHVFRRPIKAGLVGIVTSITTSEGLMTVEFLPDWDRMSQYYSSLIQTSSILDFMSDEDYYAYKAQLEEDADAPRRSRASSGSADVDEELFKRHFGEDEPVEVASGELGTYGSYKVTIDVGVDLLVHLQANYFVNEAITWRGVKLSASAGGKVEIDANIDADVQLPVFGKEKQEKEVSGICKIKIGPYLNFNANGNFNLTYSNKAGFDLSYIKNYDSDGNEIGDFQFDIIPNRDHGHLDPEFELNFSCDLSLKYQIDIAFDEKINDIVKGSLHIDMQFPYIHKSVLASGHHYSDTPQQLLDQWSNIDKKNEQGIGNKITIDNSSFEILEEKLPSKFQKYEQTVYIVHCKIPRVDLKNSSYVMIPNDDETVTARCMLFDNFYSYPYMKESENLFAVLRYNLPSGMDYELWAWDTQKKEFTFTQKIGILGGLLNHFDGKEFTINLRKGHRYEIYPTIACGALFQVYGTQGSLKPGALTTMLAPYSVETLTPDVDDMSAFGYGKIDEVAVYDNTQGDLQGKITWGFEYCLASQNLGKDAIDVPGGNLTSTNPGKMLSEELEENTKYQYRVYLLVDGEPIYGNIVEFETKEDNGCPATRPATEVEYTTATLNGYLPRRCLEDYQKYSINTDQFRLGFKYGSGRKVYVDKTFSGRNFNKEIEGLMPKTTYKFYAFAERNGIAFDAPIALYFTTKDPYKAYTGTNEPDCFSAVVYGSYEKWLHQHLSDDGTHEVRVYFSYGKTKEEVSDCVNIVEVDDEQDNYEVLAEIKELDPLTDYYYRINVEYNYLGEVHKFHGSTEMFTTLDPYWVITTETTHNSYDRYSIVLNGKMSSFFREEVSKGVINAYIEFTNEKDYWTTGYGQLYKAVADIDPETGCFSFDTDYTKNDFLFDLAEEFYYRAYITWNGDRYQGKVLTGHLPDIYHVTTGDYKDFEDYTQVYGSTHEGIAYLDSIGHYTGLQNEWTNYHMVKVSIEYSQDRTKLEDDDDDGVFEETDTLDRVYGVLDPDGNFQVDIYDMEYSSTYYYRACLQVDRWTFYGEVKELETMEWDPGLIVDAPLRRIPKRYRTEAARLRGLSSTDAEVQ